MTAPAPRPATISGHRLFQAFFFAAFALVAWQFHRILSEFYVALFGAALLALVVYPLHVRVVKALKGRTNAAAVLTSGLVVLVVVIPALLTGWAAVRQTTKLVPVVSQWMRDRGFQRGFPTSEMLPPRARELWDRGVGLLESRGVEVDPRAAMLENLDQLSGMVTSLAGAALRNLAFFVFQLGVMVFSLFFLLRDGARVVKGALELVPMPEEHKRGLVARLQTTLLAVLRGIFIVAAVQGLLAIAGFFVLGVPFAILLGALTAFFAPVPVIGTAAVWIPVAAGLALSGSMPQAIGVALWCGLFVSLTDNFMRPILIGSEAKLPILLLFFGMLGGLRVYGFAGVLVGPVIVALFLAFADIYRREFRWLLAARREET
ncbi:MAG: AI-2E family transporter [Elusimicrobia bacterium]|nr:AI-2E family transporter [Elusimicrobiota bacterium]